MNTYTKRLARQRPNLRNTSLNLTGAYLNAWMYLEQACYMRLINNERVLYRNIASHMLRRKIPKNSNVALLQMVVPGERSELKLLCVKPVKSRIDIKNKRKLNVK